jgi:hypothetical protein
MYICTRHDIKFESPRAPHIIPHFTLDSKGTVALLALKVSYLFPHSNFIKLNPHSNSTIADVEACMT